MTATPAQILSLISADMVGATALANLLGYVTYAGTPSGNVTPAHVGQELFDSVNSDWYRSTGLANTNWKKLTP